MFSLLNFVRLMFWVGLIGACFSLYNESYVWLFFFLSMLPVFGVGLVILPDNKWEQPSQFQLGQDVAPEPDAPDDVVHEYVNSEFNRR